MKHDSRKTVTRWLRVQSLLLLVGGVCVYACSDMDMPAAETGALNGPGSSVPGNDDIRDASVSSDATPSDDGAIREELPPPGRCRVRSDCPNEEHACVVYSGECIHPDQRECEDDSECKSQGSDYICDQPAKGCGDVCLRGCSVASDCDESSVCVSHRCVGKVCTTDTDCKAPNTECVGGSTQSICAKKVCKYDRDCAGGARCVIGMRSIFGECRSDWGTCQLPPY